MLLATYLLTAVNLCILISGQLVALSPFILLSSLLLWVEIIKYYKLALFKQPLFILWVCFLSILALQILNVGAFHQSSSGHILVELHKWQSMPFTFYKDIAIMTAISWFAIAGLCIASRTSTIRSNSLSIVKVIIGLSVFLCILGIAQEHAGSKSLVCTIPYNKQFFSVFPYVNNAGSFFVLVSGLALGLSWKYLPLLGLYSYCAYLVNARFATACIPVLILCKLLKRKMLYVLPFIVIGGWYIVAYEVIEERWQEYVIAFNILKDNFLWGIGTNGNGSLIILNQYTPEYMRHLLSINPFSHCDPIVYLTEYGFIAWSMLVLIMGIMLKDYLVNYKHTLTTCSGLGVLMILGHSWMDMPFRSPAVLMVMVLIVTLLRRRDESVCKLDQS